MTEPSTTGSWLLMPGVFAVAALYAAIGHGGASGYLALLALLSDHLEPASSALTALGLNLLVAGTAWAAFARAGHFRMARTWPFVVASVPAAWLGAASGVSPQAYDRLLGAVLLAAAGRLAWPICRGSPAGSRTPALLLMLPLGAGLGWISGVVGIGGGILLSPLLVLSGWAEPKPAAASSACFILANSLAGLAARIASGEGSPGTLWPFAGAALAGGLVGSRLGAQRAPPLWLNRLLAGVLALAAVKLWWTACRA